MLLSKLSDGELIALYLDGNSKSFEALIQNGYALQYVDENLNVLKTLELEGDKNKSLEYQKRMKKLLKGELTNEEND